MHYASIDADTAVAVSPATALFTPLEVTVLELARRERGKGLLPASRISSLLDRLSTRLFGSDGVRPLADPRLEALRTYVNALHRCSRPRAEAAARMLRSAGFDAVQEAWIRSVTPRCA